MGDFLELRHWGSPMVEVLKSICSTRAELEALLLDRVKAQLAKSQCLFSEFSNKANKMLARALKPTHLESAG